MKAKPRRKSNISRRGFIQHSITAAAGLGVMGKNGLLAKNGTRYSHSDSAAGKLTRRQTSELKIKEYRTLGRTGFKVSDIGFGAGDLNNPDVLNAAIEAGVNYIDTAEHYARGNSERTVGEVLKKHDRKKIFVTTKLNLAMGGRKKESIIKRFNKCLERLQLDYVDCLMIHMVPEVSWIKHEPFHEAFNEFKAAGKVRFSGLSSHGTEHSLAGPVKDSMENIFLAAAEDGRFDVGLFVYNFIQKEQGEKILKACKEKNMGTTLMKTDPVKFYSGMIQMFKRSEERGGKIPDRYKKMLEEYKVFTEQGDEFRKKYNLSSEAEVRDAAIKFVLGNPDVHSACPTFNTFEELNAYLPLSGSRLSLPEAAMLADYEKVHGRFYCRHACGECSSACPQRVPVNTIMRYYHYFTAQRREKHAMEHYASLTSRSNSNNAAVCSACSGYCQGACPYGVPIQGLLIDAHETLSL